MSFCRPVFRMSCHPDCRPRQWWVLFQRPSATWRWSSAETRRWTGRRDRWRSPSRLRRSSKSSAPSGDGRTSHRKWIFRFPDFRERFDWDKPVKTVFRSAVACSSSRRDWPALWRWPWSCSSRVYFGTPSRFRWVSDCAMEALPNGKWVRDYEWFLSIKYVKTQFTLPQNNHYSLYVHW